MSIMVRLAQLTVKDVPAFPTEPLRAMVKSWLCRLNGGHFRVLHTTRSHMALRCVACGHSTPGWEVGPRRR